MTHETLLIILLAAFCIGCPVVFGLALCKAASKPTPEDESDG